MSGATVPEACDAVCIANQIGLLNVVSILLAVLAILVGLAGIIAFINVRFLARKHARTEANSVAEEVAERVAVAYLERELPILVAAYAELERDSVRDDDADAIALSQDDGI